MLQKQVEKHVAGQKFPLNLYYTLLSLTLITSK